MAFDIPKWMKEDMGFSEVEIAAMTPLMTPQRVEALEKGYLRQSDYSRNQDKLQQDRVALTSAQTQLEEANGRLNEEIAVWATRQAEGGELTKKQQKALDDAEANQLRLTQLVRSLATAAGQDPEEALKGLAVVKTDPVTPKVTPVDTDQFLPRDAGAKLAALSLALATTVPAIAHEHFTLTGETLDTEALGREILNRINTQGNKKSTDVREVWQEMHGISDKRTAKAKETHDAEIAAAEKRGRDAALTDVNLPGPHHAPGRPQSPVMQRFSGAEHKSAINRPAPGTTVSAAVSAFRTGKYRQPAATAPTGK